MPIYEYECCKCGHYAEVLQRFSDPPIRKCEKCNGKMKKLISQSTFHLKGTGWYVTDYASKKSDSGTPKSEKAVKTETSESKSSNTEKKAKETPAKTTAKDSAKASADK